MRRSSLSAASGAHVVQAVGQLDHDDADVLAHGHEHLADGGRLLVRKAFHLDARDLGHAVHQVRDALVEGLRHLLERHARILHRVVKERGAQRFHVHAQVGQNERDLHRMHDDGSPLLRHCPLCAGVGERERPRKQRLVLLGQVGPGGFLQLGEAFLGRFGGPQAVRVRAPFGGELLFGHVRAAQKHVLHGLALRRRLQGRADQFLAPVLRVPAGPFPARFGRCGARIPCVLGSRCILGRLRLPCAAPFLVVGAHRRPSFPPCGALPGVPGHDGPRHAHVQAGSVAAHGPVAERVEEMSRSPNPSRYRTLSVNSTFDSVSFT